MMASHLLLIPLLFHGFRKVFFFWFPDVSFSDRLGGFATRPTPIFSVGSETCRVVTVLERRFLAV